MRHDLVTEARYEASASIDSLGTEDMMRVINAADREVAYAVEREIPNIALAVDEITDRVRSGGRLFYAGAGTSGRLGVLDASECPPTYNTPPEMVQALIAGGDGALRRSIENAEDSAEQGKHDLAARGFGSADSLVGIAASGRTPYVLGAMELARTIGALCVGLSCTPHSEVAQAADIAITPVPGPEVITGSTRMRAGTATKMVLNMLSTGVMVRLGYVYGNLMVNVQPSNEKLTDRARRIVSAIADVPYDEAARWLDAAGSVRAAIVMAKCGVSREDAKDRLSAARGSLRQALSENGTK
ncbi:MAG: N-acetylmuramic acid 6-phosphate etherase [Bryobacteraceae bacterium]